MVMHIREPEIEGLYLGINEKENSEKDLNKIEETFAEGKKKMNSLKIKRQKC